MGYINSLIKGSDYFATKAVAAFSTVVSSTGVFAIASNKIFEIIQQNNTNHAAQFVQKVTIAAVGVNYLTILFTGTGIRVVRRSCGCGCGCDCCGAAKQVSKVSSEVIHFTTDLFGGCLAEIGVAIAVNFFAKNIVDVVKGEQFEESETARIVFIFFGAIAATTLTGLGVGVALREAKRICAKKTELPL